ncbi:hypothetical protein SRRS_32970 [Sporomusa rhizae]|uniref:hypothetical protein n=1 Tax=Sporomusa rhizae TaxID=357999 RepID=UPI00352A26A1
MFKKLPFYLSMAIISPLFTVFLFLLIFTSPIWYILTLPYHISRRTQTEEAVVPVK